MKFAVRRGNVLVATVTTPTFDQAHLDQFRASLRPRLLKGARLIVNLKSVAEMDSMGAAELLNLHRLAVQRGATVKYCGFTGAIRALMEGIGLHDILEIFNNTEEALRAFELERPAGTTAQAVRKQRSQARTDVL